MDNVCQRQSRLVGRWKLLLLLLGIASAGAIGWQTRTANRSDVNDAYIEAQLCERQAVTAFRDGKPDEAAARLRRAVALYAKMPQDAVALNNGALARFSLYRVSGESRLLDEAGKMFERAVALAPNDRVLLCNTADALLDDAVRDLISDSVNLKFLRKSGDGSLLLYLYAEQSSKLRLLARLCAHPSTVKAVSLLERLLKLSPRDAGVVRRLRNVYAAERNADKLRGLLAHVEKYSPDLNAQEAAARDYFAGKSDEVIRAETQAQHDYLAKLVKEMGSRPRGLTYSVAVAELAKLKMTLDNVGRPADADEIVALAESARAAAASDAARRALEVALMFRAARTLAAKDSAFAALNLRTRRSLEAKDRIAVVLAGESKMKQITLADVDVRRVVDLVRLSLQQFPDDPSKWAWIILRAGDGEKAAQLAKVIHNDPIESVLQMIDWKLTPFSAGIALRTCWSLQAAGKEKEAASILKQCVALGTPMPE